MRKDETTYDSQEIWSVIHYLDPDEKHSGARAAAIVTILALALVICMVVIELYLRGL